MIQLNYKNNFALFIHLLICGGDAQVLGILDCKFLSWGWCENPRLLDAPPPGTTNADVEESFAVVVVGPDTEWPFRPSTGFLERWRPLFMCRSQYFWSTTASLEHRHFFPSVRRHLPGSGSELLEYPRWKAPHPTTKYQQTTKCGTSPNQITKHKLARKHVITLQKLVLPDFSTSCVQN